MNAGAGLPLLESLRLDCLRALRSDGPLRPLTLLRLAWHNPGLQALAAYRLLRWCRAPHDSARKRVTAALLQPFATMAGMFARVAYGITLEQSADIGPGFYIGHLGGIVVRECRIGGHSSIGQQVEIGVESNGAADGDIALIGRNVWIGAHARIARGTRIGDGATVGAGACVSSSVPARSLVLGNPGRIARQCFDNGEML